MTKRDAKAHQQILYNNLEKLKILEKLKSVKNIDFGALPGGHKEHNLSIGPKSVHGLASSSSQWVPLLNFVQFFGFVK